MKCFLLNPVIKAGSIQGNNIRNKLKYVGGNTGNIVFENAIKEQVLFEKEDWLTPRKKYSDDYVYVLPCSNFLAKENKWLEPLVDIIEKNPIRIVLVGLGAQGGLDELPSNVVKKLSRKQKRFFQIIAERCVSIGVRGEFTAECLVKLGIYNSTVIGCPSVFKWLNGELPILKTPTAEKMLITITPGKISSNLLKIGIKENSMWVMQSADELINNNKNIAIRLHGKKNFNGIPLDIIQSYQQKESKIFFDYSSWNSFLVNEKFTFTYGTRFHGNMMSLRNEIPAMWFVHDIRTLELVNSLKLPYMIIGSKECNNITCGQDIIEACDYSSFYKNYPQNVKNYCEFLKKNGIETIL